MRTRKIEKSDFNKIVEVIDHWWGGPISTFAHPIFFYELGHAALVVEKEDQMIGFLLGFIAPNARAIASDSTPSHHVGYVHLVGIHPDHRRQGVGRTLYENFERECAAAGCESVKAITTPGHEGSIRFHLAQGWNATEVEDYAGPGRKRMIFAKPLVSK